MITIKRKSAMTLGMIPIRTATSMVSSRDGFWTLLDWALLGSVQFMMGISGTEGRLQPPGQTWQEYTSNTCWMSKYIVDDECHCVSYIHALIYIVKAVQTSQGRSHQYSWSSFNQTTFWVHQNCFLHTLLWAAPPADLHVRLSSFKIDAKMARTRVKTSFPGLSDKPSS